MSEEAKLKEETEALKLGVEKFVDSVVFAANAEELKSKREQKSAGSRSASPMAEEVKLKEETEALELAVENFVDSVVFAANAEELRSKRELKEWLRLVELQSNRSTHEHTPSARTPSSTPSLKERELKEEKEEIIYNDKTPIYTQIHHKHSAEEEEENIYNYIHNDKENTKITQDNACAEMAQSCLLALATAQLPSLRGI